MVSEFVDGGPSRSVGATDAIGRPPIELIEALRASVAREDPQGRIAKSEIEQAPASRGDQRNSNAAAPMVRIDIEAAQLS